ncbi:hypothetical protein R3I93_000060 [Phoxinus phoxinus]|uniref:Uncharacterized protein n=1 Tax=Phoxinus phoxinus TaxID=58324 RepID=A0AAN9DQU3_9TELE
MLGQVFFLDQQISSPQLWTLELSTRPNSRTLIEMAS